MDCFRENYLFTCQCIKCEAQAGDPDITSDDEGDDEESDEDMDEGCTENGTETIGIVPPQQ